MDDIAILIMLYGIFIIPIFIISIAMYCFKLYTIGTVMLLLSYLLGALPWIKDNSILISISAVLFVWLFIISLSLEDV
jgi:hypothetical protein